MHKYKILLALCLFVLFAFLKALSAYYGFKIDGGDPAVFQQMFFNTFQGRFLVSTFEGGNHLGVHFSPALIALAPLMWLFKSSLALFSLSSICLAVASWMLYGHLKNEGHEGAGVLLVIIMIYHSTLTYNGIRDFHPLALLPLPFVGAFISWEKRRLKAFLIWCCVMVSLRENVFLIPIAWAIVGGIKKRSAPWIVWPAVIGAAHFILAWLAAPHFFEGGIQPGIMDYYQGYGHSFSQMLASVAWEPELPFSFLFQESKLHYILGVAGPFLMVLPFLRWWWLPGLPTLGLVLFSSHGRLMFPELHYSIEVVLWFVISTVFLFRSHPGFFEKPAVKRAIAILVLVMLLDLSWKVVDNAHGFMQHRTSDRYRHFQTVKERIPGDIHLVAPRSLALHLANRQHLHFLHETRENHGWDKMDLAVLMEEDRDKVPSNWTEDFRSGDVILMRPPERR